MAFKEHFGWRKLEENEFGKGKTEGKVKRRKRKEGILAMAEDEK